jgi:hypothetical protein
MLVTYVIIVTPPQINASHVQISQNASHVILAVTVCNAFKAIIKTIAVGAHNAHKTVPIVLMELTAHNVITHFI